MPLGALAPYVNLGLNALALYFGLESEQGLEEIQRELSRRGSAPDQGDDQAPNEGSGCARPRPGSDEWNEDLEYLENELAMADDEPRRHRHCHCDE